jgi:peptidoglycan/xylan/chitin deacetylase (PgdA/CDA1 family)
VPTEQLDAPALRRPLLLRQADLGGFDDPGPRPLPAPGALLRWGRPALLPVSSIMRVSTAEPVLSLTYDDGPHPEHTPALLDVLREHGARATFFVLTGRAREHPELVHRMLAEGHEVGLHGIDHVRLTTLPGREAARRLRRAKRELEAITGRPVEWYRPTYGAVSISAFVAARAMGMRTVIWSAWGRDWEDAPAEEVAGRVVRALHPGAVVLLHDVTEDAEALAAGPAPTFDRADVLRGVLAGMRAGGYTSLPVGELLRRHPAVRSVTVQRPRLPLRGR